MESVRKQTRILMYNSFGSLVGINKIDKENQLPLNSGADSFFEMHWKLEKSDEIFQLTADNSPLMERFKILGKMVNSFIDSMKEEWLLSDPILSILPESRTISVKMCMRRKEVYKELNEQ
jgi:hypothetical protein